ncbi:hypothetical protein KHAB170019_28720 [Acinetobacter baumannii]|nr:hypothetical protein KHAB170019_28720 [Acinetobacter baumannii]
MQAGFMLKPNTQKKKNLQEICPTFVGANKKLETNTQKIIAMYLSGYSNKSITFSALQNDSEYKTLLSEARQAAKEMDHHEQHELCEEVVNYKD